MQVMDTGERLQGYLKSDLNDVVRETCILLCPRSRDRQAERRRSGRPPRFHAHASTRRAVTAPLHPWSRIAPRLASLIRICSRAIAAPRRGRRSRVTTADSGTARSARSRLTTLHQLTARWTFQTEIVPRRSFEGTPRGRRRHADWTVRERLGTRRAPGGRSGATGASCRTTSPTARFHPSTAASASLATACSW